MSLNDLLNKPSLSAGNCMAMDDVAELQSKARAHAIHAAELQHVLDQRKAGIVKPEPMSEEARELAASISWSDARPTR
jgi:hypothetical protein